MNISNTITQVVSIYLTEEDEQKSILKIEPKIEVAVEKNIESEDDNNKSEARATNDKNHEFEDFYSGYFDQNLVTQLENLKFFG